jgi:hypothetical protein
MSVLFISRTNYSHTREFHSDRNGWEIKECRGRGVRSGCTALILRTRVAHDLLIDGTALELRDTAASLLLILEMIVH